MITRRRLLTTLVAAAFVTPTSFAAQHVAPGRLGFLFQTDLNMLGVSDHLAEFHSEMRRLGYMVDKDYSIDFRASRGDAERASALAKELVKTRPNIVVALSTQAALALKSATADIPILFVTVGDPVGSGVVTNLSRPEGNITGISNMATFLYSKKLELLRELVPKLERVGFLFNPGAVNERRDSALLPALAEKLRMRVIAAPAPADADLHGVFEKLTQEKAGAVIVASGVNNERRLALAAQAAKHRLPAVYSSVEFVVEGGLISYSGDSAEQFRKLATYVDKLFRGAKPRDLPVEQVMKLELAVNLKAAKAVGIAITEAVLLRADKVIE